MAIPIIWADICTDVFAKYANRTPIFKLAGNSSSLAKVNTPFDYVLTYNLEFNDFVDSTILWGENAIARVITSLEWLHWVAIAKSSCTSLVLS